MLHAGSSAPRRQSTILDRARGVGALFTALVIGALILRWYGLSLNVTDSMPIGLYHLERANLPVARGTIVAACLPISVAALGRRQGYLLSGTCPGGAAPILKLVAATGGDRVQVSDRQILVNGKPLPGSGTQTQDSHGRRLLRVAPGAYTLGAGELWFWTPNPASWDSRYYGPVTERQVLGQATLLFALAPWDFGNTRTAAAQRPGGR